MGVYGGVLFGVDILSFFDLRTDNLMVCCSVGVIEYRMVLGAIAKRIDGRELSAEVRGE